jgi:hypothetical protein
MLDLKVLGVLAGAGTVPLPQRGQNAEHQEHRATAEIPDQVQRRYRLASGSPDGVQRARQRDVGDVVAGTVGQRAVLSPPCHPGVHQPRVAGVAVGGTDAQPLDDTGTQTLDQHVGPLHQPEHGFSPGGVLQVEHYRAPAAEHLIVGGGG